MRLPGHPRTFTLAQLRIWSLLIETRDALPRRRRLLRPRLSTVIRLGSDDHLVCMQRRRPLIDSSRSERPSRCRLSARLSAGAVIRSTPKSSVRSGRDAIAETVHQCTRSEWGPPPAPLRRPTRPTRLQMMLCKWRFTEEAAAGGISEPLPPPGPPGWEYRRDPDP